MNQSTRKCTACKADKSASEFGKNSRSPSGLKSWCRPCTNAYEKSRLDKNPAARESRRAAGREAMRRWSKEHPEINRAKTREWYKKNRAVVLAQQKTPEGRARTSAHNAKRRENPEFRAESAARSKAWRELNPDRQREGIRRSQSKRRARLALVQVVGFTPTQLEARMAYFGNRCWMCKGAFENIDHVKPVKAGGPHMLANFRPACAPCNQSKSAKWSVASELHKFMK